MYEELIRILQQAGLGEHSDIPNIPRIAPVSQVAHFWWRRQYIAMQRIWLARIRHNAVFHVAMVYMAVLQQYWSNQNSQKIRIR